MNPNHSPDPRTIPTTASEQVKLALLKLQQEEFLQTIAELCGQQRTPQIPKEAPTAVRDRDDLKLKLRVRFAGCGWARGCVWVCVEEVCMHP